MQEDAYFFWSILIEQLVVVLMIRRETILSNLDQIHFRVAAGGYIAYPCSRNVAITIRMPFSTHYNYYIYENDNIYSSFLCEPS